MTPKNQNQLIKLVMIPFGNHPIVILWLRWMIQPKLITTSKLMRIKLWKCLKLRKRRKLMILAKYVRIVTTFLNSLESAFMMCHWYLHLLRYTDANGPKNNTTTCFWFSYTLDLSCLLFTRPLYHSVLGD